MSKTLAMFPGQGSQYVGMGRQLVELFPKSIQTFEEVEDAIKFPIRKLCFDGPESELKLTKNTQPAIVAVSIAMWRVLQEETEIQPYAFAGHSLGEYSAVTASGKLDLSQASFLVRKRGEAMQRAVPEGVGAMAAVLKYEESLLEEKCKAFSKNDEEMVQVANYNMDQQQVIAGHKSAVESLCAELSSEGVRTTLLPVSAPFHTKLMGKAREEMTPLLLESSIKKNEEKIITNLTADVVEDYSADYLIKQIDHPVLWNQSLKNSQKLGIDTYIEIGPGKVLFGMVRRSIPRGTAANFATDNIADAIKALNTHLEK